MAEDCPCTPMAAFVAETEGRFNLIEEKFNNGAEKIHAMAEGMQASATQIELGCRTLIKLQGTIAQQNDRLKNGNARFTKVEKNVKKLGIATAFVAAFILTMHGDAAWALIKLLL